jgi:hypothetical protein
MMILSCFVGGKLQVIFLLKLDMHHNLVVRPIVMYLLLERW